MRATSWAEPPEFPFLHPVLEGEVGGVDGAEPLGGPAVVGVRLHGLLAVGGLQLVGGGVGREPREVEGVGGPEDVARLALGHPFPGGSPLVEAAVALDGGGVG